jgi:hypothetical protein
MKNRISKVDMQEFCRTVCQSFGERFTGHFSLEMDLRMSSRVLSLRGEKQWYKARDSQDGLEVLDNQGHLLRVIPGLALPPCEQMEDFVIESKVPACESIFADMLPQSAPASKNAAIAPFSLKIMPEMSQRELLEVIKAFLQNSQNISGTLHRKENLFWLVVEIPTQNLSTMRLIVTSQVSGKTENEKQCTERVLLLRLFTRAYVPPEQRFRYLELLNSYLNRCWAGIFRIHQDNEIEGGWSQNILRGGLFVEYVWDAIIRLLSGWKSLAGEIRRLEETTPP